ncbi:hypothetical protein ACFQ7F_35245 [Streptomyces sp. NPDC056486]|uniref:hypothetical protein n=1 Tax=Streptomyces sp. NPDC056486 TaxID=3345835 RepID=UPI00369C9659
MSLDDERNDGLYGGSGETRTRLPEGEGGGQDVYGGGRRSSRSSSRSLVTVVGVVVVLIAAIAFANRGGGGEESAGGGGDGKKAGADPTAASGARPVDGKTSGIASGFAKSEQGAQSAAANYAVALGSADMFNKAKRDSVLQAVMAPSSVNQFKTELDKAYSVGFFKNVGLNQDGSTPKGYQFVSRTSPIGTKVTNYAPGKATVEVWCSGLLGLAGEKSTKPVTSSWFTITMKLEWVGGDWKAATHSQKDGPAPVPGDERASGSDEISKAAEGYGGFTYAR